MRSLANRWFSGGITGCSNAKLSIRGAYQEILMITGSLFHGVIYSRCAHLTCNFPEFHFSLLNKSSRPGSVISSTCYTADL